MILLNLVPQLNADVEVRTTGVLHMNLALGVLCPGGTFFHTFLIACPRAHSSQRAPVQLSWSLEAGLGTGPQLVLAVRGSSGALLAWVWEPGGLGRTHSGALPQIRELQTDSLSIPTSARNSGSLFIYLLSSADCGVLGTKTLPLPGSEACGLTARNRPGLTLEAGLVSA